MRLVRQPRLTASWSSSIITTIVSLVLALLVGSVVLVICRVNPWTTYIILFKKAFASSYGFSETLVKATPLMFCGLASGLAFKRNFINVGAEGQLIIGATATTWVILFPPAWLVLPSWLVIPAAALAAMTAGSLWCLFPAILKNLSDEISEVVITLMLNFIAALVTQSLIHGQWKDPKGFGFAQSAPFPRNTWLPTLAGRAHLGLVVALFAALIMWFIYKKTTLGYEIKMIGANPQCCRAVGMDLKQNLCVVALFSGALAGLAGWSEVLGINHRLSSGIIAGYGIVAILVAELAQRNPFASLLAAILVAGLSVGANQLQVSLGIPASLGTILQGLILFCLIGGEFLRKHDFRLERR